ncbi:multidrug resistance-associated ABC transporter [Mycena belliarum]|uniref:Multidrug resistance-associated ABC transporter n=1 Tax=Mycena belliarum TaxID=1033014 RepID=A0AAD6TXS0_9AGAR|nr:multidrug resistance-associated ABC transporter [Mycena belliae]
MNSEHVLGLSVAHHVAKRWGRTILRFQVARVMGCLLLLALAAEAAALDDENHPENTPAMALIFYTACLAILSVLAGQKWSRIVTQHLNTVLLSTFLVYSYRDIFPFTTNALVPMDLWEGQLLWPKVITLFAVSGIIPLIIPRRYIPLNSENPMPVVNPEQTASLLSSALYFFLDPIIFLAYRIPHLSFDLLPPLCDYDAAENLKVRAFPHLDPFTAGKKRHVFYGFVWIFRRELLSRVIVMTIAGLSSFIAPLAIKKLLSHLEDPDADAFMKPWVWISLLFLGPLIYSVAYQRDMFIATRVMNQMSAISMQLVFEHALRIRVQAETAMRSRDHPLQTPPRKEKANLRGKINTLLTVDRNNISEASNVLIALVLVPIQIIGSIVFLYLVLDWRLVLFMTMVALFPLPGYVAKTLSAVQKKVLEGTDERVQVVSETMSMIRMIKMFGWEEQMQQKIQEKRNVELNWIWWEKMAFMANALLRQELSAAKVFSSMTVFDLLRNQLGLISVCVARAIKGKVSLERLTDFLQNTKLLDSFNAAHSADGGFADEPSSQLIGFRNVMFTWTSPDPTDARITPSREPFTLKIEGDVFFKQGLNLVVGPTGSGKTSLLMALLGEMHMIPSSPTSWFNLPRGGGVSYAAQESWVLNDTIKNNIIFHTPMDTERYRKVLYQCCLERDLEMFNAGDETEIGEKGLTLSGGQKARITLARAVYADTRVVLLDDIFAALDVLTAQWIVDKCLTGDLIQHRTVILVTHNVALTRNLLGSVMSVSLDGSVHSRGSISDALVKDKLLSTEVINDQAIAEIADQEIDSTPVAKDVLQKTDGKLIVAEEIEFGHVTWGALRMFFFAHTVGNAALFFTILAVIIVLTSVASRLETWYLGYWASQYGSGTPVSVFNHCIHPWHAALIVLGNMLANTTGYIYFTLGSFNASKTIHTQFITSVLAATFRWLDVTPTSRILSRCTADTEAIDDFLSESFWEVIVSLIEATVQMLTRLLAVVFFAPLFFIPGLVVGLLGGWCGQIYMASQLSVKREMSNARSPVLGHINASISGLVSVRAYGAQNTSIQISLDRIDRLTRASRTFSNLNRWISVRMSASLSITAMLAYYLIYFQMQQPSNVGFTLTMAMAFSQGILSCVQLFNRFEVQSNSLERIKQYIETEQEPTPTQDGIPPAYWPATGSLHIEGMSAMYSPDGPKVLQDISFDIQSGERIGIVGRTGSGKSSLTLALLRCIFTEGTVYYDGLPTSSVNLSALRSNMTIIPQVPELLEGTLRTNLDMFGEFNDTALNAALDAAGLSSLQADLEDGKLTLDSEIASGGANVSMGQRQIIAIARAIIRRTKVLILDEDYKTDAVIQMSLRTQLPSDTTCLIVAHRLQSVMDADRIVCQLPRRVEFDSPKALLRMENGMLRALVNESRDKRVLYEMAGY